MSSQYFAPFEQAPPRHVSMPPQHRSSHQNKKCTMCNKGQVCVSCVHHEKVQYPVSKGFNKVVTNHVSDIDSIFGLMLKNASAGSNMFQ